VKPPENYPVGETVCVDVEYTRKPANTDSIQQIYGGVKMTVDGYELTRYKRQENLEDEYGRSYEYKGDYPKLVITNLLRHVSEFVRGEVDLTGLGESTERRVELHDAMGYIVISWLSEDTARIAFQVPSTGVFSPSIPVYSEVGFAVGIEDLVRAVTEASEELITYINDSDIQGSNSLSDLEEITTELREFNST
jgi:hypothetical protein